MESVHNSILADPALIAMLSVCLAGLVFLCFFLMALMSERGRPRVAHLLDSTGHGRTEQAKLKTWMGLPRQTSKKRQPAVVVCLPSTTAGPLPPAELMQSHYRR